MLAMFLNDPPPGHIPPNPSYLNSSIDRTDTDFRRQNQIVEVDWNLTIFGRWFGDSWILPSYFTDGKTKAKRGKVTCNGNSALNNHIPT